jgi:uncharacterized membrane protein YkgB
MKRYTIYIIQILLIVLLYNISKGLEGGLLVNSLCLITYISCLLILVKYHQERNLTKLRI